MWLTIGDKVRLISTKEAGEIIEVYDEDFALIEFFDDERKTHKSELISYSIDDSHQRIERFVPRDEKANEKWEKRPKKKLEIIEKSCTIDLHATALKLDSINRSTEEILSIQLSRLTSFITRSQLNHCKEITIIHGKGSGRLMAEVHTLLRLHDEVKSFNQNNQGLDKGQTIAYLG